MYGLSAEGSHLQLCLTGGSWRPHCGKDAFVQGFTISHQDGFVGGIVFWEQIVFPFKQNGFTHRLCNGPFCIEPVTAGHQYFTVIQHQVGRRAGNPMQHMLHCTAIVRNLFTGEAVGDKQQRFERFYKRNSFQLFLLLQGLFSLRLFFPACNGR